MTPWERFVTVARGGTADKIPVAFGVDSPWIPGFFGIDTLDYFLRPDEWLRVNLALRERFPEIAWIPGFWIEYGMAAEPSAFGARIVWHHDRPPSIEPVAGGITTLLKFDPADPYQHGLMPLVLQRYADAEQRLLPEGLNIKMVAARGPLAVAGWLLGITDLLIGLKTEPEAHARLLDTLTTTIIAWLRAQLSVLRAPEAILVLDDIVGMLSPKLFEQFARPYFSRIFDEFRGLIRVYHNDTPCPHLLERLATLDFEVFNFSHEMDIADVQAKMPRVALMGNIPPLDVMVRGTPAQAEAWARECIRKTNGRGLILSAGGGMSPGTPAETIEAVVRATEDG
ncbi:MAG: uroporphyrinogen decarboxylase family protein [Anaerolineae bacterium]|nr:uroporphyrinogen decarboxylase family protein [Anaerolineae bacterium]